MWLGSRLASTSLSTPRAGCRARPPCSARPASGDAATRDRVTESRRAAPADAGPDEGDAARAAGEPVQLGGGAEAGASGGLESGVRRGHIDKCESARGRRGAIRVLRRVTANSSTGFATSSLRYERCFDSEVRVAAAPSCAAGPEKSVNT